MTDCDCYFLAHVQQALRRRKNPTFYTSPPRLPWPDSFSDGSTVNGGDIVTVNELYTHVRANTDYVRAVQDGDIIGIHRYVFWSHFVGYRSGAGRVSAIPGQLVSSENVTETRAAIWMSW